MKMFFLPLICLLTPLAVAFGGFNVPSSVHDIEGISKAQESARQKNRPVTFLYSDRNTTCGLCEGASVAAIKEFNSKSEMVFVDTKQPDWKQLPRQVQEALAKPEAGKFIPKVVIFDPELSNVIAIVPYTRDPNQRQRSFREATAKIRESMGSRSGASSTTGASSATSDWNDRFKRRE